MGVRSVHLHLSEQLTNAKTEPDSATKGRIESTNDLQAWIWPRETSKYANSRRDSTSSLRLLVCEREYYNPVGFSMTKGNFVEIATVFRLPKNTLQVLCNNGGLYGKNFVRLGGSSEEGKGPVIGIR